MLALDPEISAALAELGLHAVRVEPITALSTGDDRLTLRVEVAGGRVVKVRRVAHAHQVRQHVAMLALVGEARLTPVLHHAGRVTVEPWIDGAVLIDLPITLGRLAGAAQLLGRLHAVRWGRRSTARILRRARRQLVRLVAAGIIDGLLAQRTLSALATAPARAAFGVTHTDLCATNLVENPAGQIIAIDNERLQPGFLDYDVARTWYRWPMSAGAWDELIGHYHVWRALPSASWTFWRVVVLVGSVHLRRHGVADVIAVPRDRLRALLADPA